MAYTRFERLRTALDHKEPDRVPCDFGAAEVAGINVHTMRNLRAHLGLCPDVEMDNKVIQTGNIQDDLIERLRVDVKIVPPKPPLSQPLAKELGLQDGYHRLTCECGMGWQMLEQGGHYYDLYHSPLAKAEAVGDIENYPWPIPWIPGGSKA